MDPSYAVGTQSIVLKPEALILGGGIVGISVARLLAGGGIHVTLLEKGDRLGGKALDLRTFYNRSEDVRKWIDEKISEIEKTPNATILTKAELRRVDGHLGRFEARIQTGNGTEAIASPSVIVVATGYVAEPEK